MLNKRSMPLFALSAAGLVACGGGSSDPQYDRIATGVSAMMTDPNSGEPSSFKDSMLVVRGELPSNLALSGAGVISGRRGELDVKYEVVCKDATEATLAACVGAASADFKAQWKGKVEGARYKLEVDRKGEWKVKGFDGTVATLNGHTSYHVKSDFKDPAEELRHKYDFDFDTQYHNVEVRVSDGALVGGRADYDLDAKEMSEDGSATVKTQLKVRTVVEFSDGDEAMVTFDDRYQYRVHLDSGDVRFEADLK